MNTNNFDFSSANAYYKSKGYTAAKESKAFFATFQSWMGKIISKIAQDSAENADKEGQRQKDYEDRLNSVKGLKQSIKEGVESLEKKVIPDKRNEINTLKDEIQDIQGNPNQVLTDHFTDGSGGSSGYDPFSFAFSIIILLGLTCYLFQFYLSGGYSAFFRNMGAELAGDSQLTLAFSSVFYANAFSEAQETGSLLFVLSFPFIAFGFGFMVHLFVKQQKKKVAALLVAVILFFDGLLAHEILRKIYEVKLMSGMVHGMWSTTKVFTSPEFYLIILSGFAVYLLWGYLLGYIIKQNEMRKPFKVAIKRRMLRIETLEKEIAEDTAKMDVLAKAVTEHETEIKRLERLLKDFIYFNYEHFCECVNSFAVGWCEYLANASLSDGQVQIQQVRDYVHTTIENMRHSSQ